MRVAITGVTGLLGRNFLFEFILQNKKKLSKIEIIIFGRSLGEKEFGDRIINIIERDGLEYIGIEEHRKKRFLHWLRKRIKPIGFDLTKEDLSISEEDMNYLKTKKIDKFYHIAALTDFRSDETTKKKLWDINIGGTDRVLNLIDKLDIGQLCYVGSAYSCGSKYGIVDPDYVNTNEIFRNPYEESKLIAEIAAVNFAKKRSLPYIIFRPTTICGRLIEKPLGSINKFDVFYGWAGFFLRIKFKALGSIEKLYSEQMNMPVRVAVNHGSGLNIVPADYAAKIMYFASMDNSAENCYHLASDDDIGHIIYNNVMCKCLGIGGFKYVKDIPEDKNEIEKFYYKTVGKIFTPYITGKPIIFETSNTKKYRMENNFACPVMDEENFEVLIEYAKSKNFGMSPE